MNIYRLLPITAPLAMPIVMLGAATLLLPVTTLASSHREAPFITEQPKVDATDFYMFNSYEPGRTGYVTLVANYVPLQAPYGGPNYFSMDPDALYEIHVDNNGDAKEDITFQFRFNNKLKDIALKIGSPGQEKKVSVPLMNVGAISAGHTDNLNVTESYTVTMVKGDRRTGAGKAVTNTATGANSFVKPVDNIGNKSIPDYAAYAASHIYHVNIPGCGGTSKMFVGQRKDSFAINIGEVFDLVNTNPLGPVDGEKDDLADANVTSMILEVPAACLTSRGPVVAGWTTASLRQARLLNPVPSYNKPAIEGGAWTQVSRLGMPLVNEVVIGLKDKDKFNASKPQDDGQFADYVTHPTLPALLEALFGVKAPTKFPRSDLVTAFLTGITGLNQTAVTAEMLRLNTSTLITPAASQSNLGVLAGDNAGFPNGRRPGDDVVDIALRVAMGVLLPVTDAPDGQRAYTDGTVVNASMFDNAFPYLKMPLPGSPN